VDSAPNLGRPMLRSLALGLLALACASALSTPAENDWARVTEASLVRRPLGGAPGQFTVRYTFALAPKREDLASVDIFDVSNVDPVPLVSGARIGGDNSWSSALFPLSAQGVPWMFTSGPTRKLFRFVLTAQSGETSTLEQAVLFSAETKAFYRKKIRP
jgi:hypothetical protein